MPSFSIKELHVELKVFEVLGADGPEAGFIKHTALAANGGVQSAHAVNVVDMGPPLHGPAHMHTMHATVVGRAELTDDEVQKIKVFVDQHSGEHQAFNSLRDALRYAPQIYCIYPHADPLREDDGRYVRMRFSCAGFVVEAYRFARIELIDLANLPKIDMGVIDATYPMLSPILRNGTITANSLGLGGDGPWPVLLCGYLFHALDRNADAIRAGPATPLPEHRYFPSR
jgi:hypothetical protein